MMLSIAEGLFMQQKNYFFSRSTWRSVCIYLMDTLKSPETYVQNFYIFSHLLCGLSAFEYSNLVSDLKKKKKMVGEGEVFRSLFLILTGVWNSNIVFSPHELSCSFTSSESRMLLSTPLVRLFMKVYIITRTNL